MHRNVPRLLVTAAVCLTSTALIAGPKSDLASMMRQSNARLAEQGANYRIAYAEYLTSAGSGEAGSTVYAFNPGNKQLSYDFVPFDPRGEELGWDIDDVITYVVDQSEGAASGGLTNAQTEAAIDRAMSTWNDDTACSNLPIEKLADPGTDIDVIDFFAGQGTYGSPNAEIVHAGWYSWIDDVLGNPYVLGVTFTLIWTDEDDNPTDINFDGKGDVAWREIYYSNEWDWGIDVGYSLSDTEIDVESVALHESGHGLSQAHFGKIHTTDSQGNWLHFSPRAVMNAAYVFNSQDLLGSDIAGHCSIWGNWPVE